MKFVKVFIPNHHLSDYHQLSARLIYGSIQHETDSLKFFINLITEQESANQNHSNLIGVIDSTTEFSNNDFITLSTSRTLDEKFAVTVNGIRFKGESINSDNVCLFVYDSTRFENLAKNEYIFTSTADNDIIYLLKLIKLSKTKPNTVGSSTLCHLRQMLLSIVALLSWIFSPFKSLFVQTAIYQHFKEWQKCLRVYSFENYKSYTIVFDMVAGVAVLLVVLYMNMDPGKSLMDFTELIVNKLRLLLEALKGSPVGLKLNVLLNNFFLDCFIYHVDLWWTFLVIVSPAIQYLFLPLAVLGFFGLSFQLSMLSDLLILISLHAHCFYIYSAVLYQIEIVGLQALWRVVLGRRKNVLRGRVESYDYFNRQLYIATLLFAALIFLLPTILVYYVVFATLRFGCFCLTYILMVLRKNILKFPIYTLLRWLRGIYVNLDCMELSIIGTDSYKSHKRNVTVIFIKPKSSSPWTNSVFENKHHPHGFDGEVADADAKNIGLHTKGHRITIGKFLKGLVKGEMMGFIQPEQKFYGKNQ